MFHGYKAEIAAPAETMADVYTRHTERTHLGNDNDLGKTSNYATSITLDLSWESLGPSWKWDSVLEREFTFAVIVASDRHPVSTGC